MAIKIDAGVTGLNKTLIEEGIVIDALGVDGEPLFLSGDENKPLQMRVRSARSEAVKANDLKAQKAQASVRGRRNPGSNMEPTDKFILRQSSVMLMELINFSAAAPLQMMDEKAAAEFLGNPEFEHFRDQVFQTGNDDRNYGGKTSGNAQGGGIQDAPTSEDSSID